MLKILSAGSLAFSSLLLTAVHAQTSLDVEKIDSYLEAASARYGFSGVVLVAQKGTVLLHKGYGWKDVKDKVPNDTSGIFQIGSVTKQFTATIILKLQEEGKLTLSDPISKYLPGYPNGEKITLYHLLTHTSGIDDYTKHFKPLQFIFKKTVSKQKVINTVKNKELSFAPGTQFQYSSTNYYLLGLIIEKVTGKPYEQVVHETIFAPLQMTHTGFDFRNLSDPGKTTGYSVFYKERQIRANDDDSTILYAAGGIYSTTGDLYKWIRAIANQQILTRQSWKQALTPNKGFYGLGWAIDTLHGRKYITHNGITSGFSGLLLYFPDEDICLILLRNTTGSLWNTGVAVSQIIFNSPYLWGNQAEVTPDTTILKQYMGTYVYDKIYKLTVSVKEGQLYFNGTPNTAINNAAFIALSDTSFFNTNLYLRIEFIKDSSGKVTGFKGIREGWYLTWIREN